MPRPSSSHRVQDMYWFAHGGIDCTDNPVRDAREGTPNSVEAEEDTSEAVLLTSKQEHTTASEDIPAAGARSADRQDSKGASNTKRLAVEERKRQIQEAEQEKNEAILKKHADRDAALEARRNAQRNNLSFAFRTTLLPNMEFDILPVQIQHQEHSRPTKSAANQMSQSMMSQSMMSQSMTASMISNGTRGRRKNDLTPTVPYERMPLSSRSVNGATRKRSVSMSRLDQLALPRKPYVESQKAGSTLSNASSTRKEQLNSPKRPLSSASEKSHRSPRSAPSVAPVVHRRPQTATRKPRPVSIAGTVPDSRPSATKNPTPQRRFMVQTKKSESPKATSEVKAKTPPSASSRRSKVDVSKKEEPEKPNTPPAKGPVTKLKTSAIKQTTPKTSPARKLLTNKKKAAMLGAAAKDSASDTSTEAAKSADLPAQSSFDEDSLSADEKSSTKQHIASEEEARASLAEKRRLAREQAEKEAELERQKQEQLKREEELQRQKDEEEQRRMEEEQLRLLEEHKRFEEEKLQKAIQVQEKREEEEKNKRDEEARLKVEQEKKAKEEAEKQRIELEEKLRKEEEERAERKKRLDKIMSRTRGKSGTASPSGSLNGSDPPDSIENQPLSSEPSSLESNEQFQVMEQSSPTESFDIHQTLQLVSQSLSSNDLMLPSSQHTSLDGSVQAFASEPASLDDQEQKEVVESNKIDCSTDEFVSQQSSDIVKPEEETVSEYDIKSVPSEIEINQADKIVKEEVMVQFSEIPNPFVEDIPPVACYQFETAVQHIGGLDSDFVQEPSEVSKHQVEDDFVGMTSQQYDSNYVQSVEQNSFFMSENLPGQPEEADFVQPEPLNQVGIDQSAEGDFYGHNYVMPIPHTVFDESRQVGMGDFKSEMIGNPIENIDDLSQAFTDNVLITRGIETDAVLVEKTSSKNEHVPINDHVIGYDQSENWARVNNPFDEPINHVTDNEGNYSQDLNLLQATEKELQHDVTAESRNIFSDASVVYDSELGMGYPSDVHSISSTGESAVFEVTSDFTAGTIPGLDNFVPKFCDQTHNPFASNKPLNSAIDFIAEESEESSLDSNLSQVMNVNTSGVEKTVSAFVEEDSLINGLSHCLYGENTANAFCDKEDVPQSNGCNGRSHENRTSSDKTSAEQVSSSSGKLQHGNGNVESRDIFYLDNGDLTNSNKVAANPFLGSADANPFSTNLF